MANTYESKFKGVEIDDGVNTATYATGTGGINVTIKGTTNVTGTGGRHLEIDGSGKQDKLTVSSNVHINSLTIAKTSADGLYFTNETGAGISYRILNAAGSGTAPLARLTVPNDIAGQTQTIATREYVNAHSSSYNPGSGINISGNTISLDKHIMVDNITLGNYSSGNVRLLPQSGASGNAYLPKYGGYLATTGDIPAIVPITGTGTTTVMSQKAVTDELGKKQDKITDQTSLNVGALTAKGYSSLNGIFVDNSTTKPICFKRNGSIVTKMYGPTSGGGELVNVYLPGKGGTLALTSDIPTGGGGTTITVNGTAQSALKAAIYPGSVTGGVGDGETLALFDELGGLSSVYTDTEMVTVSDSTEKNYRMDIFPTGIDFLSDGRTNPDLDDGSWLRLHGPTAISGGSFVHDIYLPQKSGTIALLSDITGGGNINLYRHDVSIKRGTTGARYIYTSLYSSKDTPIDSLTDLKTMLNLSASETYPAYGLYNDGMDHQVMYIQPVGANLAVAYMTGSLTTTTLLSGVVTDTIKTI